MENFSENTKNLWEKLYQTFRFVSLYPNERVIQFVFQEFPREKAGEFSILDHGCGGGRHLVFLEENGYNAYGNDISSTGLNRAKKVLEARNLKANLQFVAGDTFQYPDEFFDGVISFGVLYYLSHDSITRVISEIKRVLKKGGKGLFILRSTKDYRIKHAKVIGNGDYLVLGDKTKSSVENEKGMLMHFFSEDEIKERCKDFSEIVIDELYNSYGGGSMLTMIMR